MYLENGLQPGSKDHNAQAIVESALRVTAYPKHVNDMILRRYVKKLENRTEEERENISCTSNYANRKVFSDDQERELKE